MADRARLASTRTEAARIERELERMLNVICGSDDVEASKRLARRMTELEKHKEELDLRLSSAERPSPLLHPSLAQVYRERISSLSEALGRPDTRSEAAEAIRSLVSGIELAPDDGKLAIVLRGDLAAMLTFAAQTKKPVTLSLEAGLLSAMVSEELMGAGTRNLRFLRLTEHRLAAA